MSFSGSHAVVTGGSSGIGRALVRQLADQGASVSILALDDHDLEAAAGEYDDLQETVTTHPVDVGEHRQVEVAVGDAVAAHGPCDLLIASAGISRPGRFLELDNDQFVRHMRVNYFGVLHSIRAVAPSMVERRTGGIVAISSAAGLLGVYGYSAYGPTKYALRGLCDVLRTELKPHGVYVGCVFPTDVDTPQFAGEQPYLPDETKSISGTVSPRDPVAVASAILNGAAKRKAYIFTDPATSWLEKATRLSPGLTRAWLDWRVRLAGS